jgi:uncharacterized membrane protein
VFLEHALLAGDNYVTRNLVELNVYVQTNSITYIVESQDYEFIQMLSDLGGVLGLYLGMCIISAVEMFEMLCLLVYITCRRMYGAVSSQQYEEVVRWRLHSMRKTSFLFKNSFDFAST